MQSRDWLAELDERLRSQLEFLVEVGHLTAIVRGTRTADGSRRENSAEHSWHLAMFATVLAEYADGPVDVGRVVRMLLIHDIVEIDAGDTPVFGGTSAAEQAIGEQQAARRLFGMLPPDQAGELLELWTEFEAAETDDAKFAKALDRLQPTVLNHVVGGGTWIDYDVDDATERSATQVIADGSPTLWEAAGAVRADAIDHGWLRP